MKHNQEGYQRLREQASSHTVQPQPHLWSRIEERLDAKDARRRTVRYQYLAVAASMLLAVSLSINYFLSTSLSESKASYAYAVQDLDSYEHPTSIYSVDKVHSMKDVYEDKR